MREQIARARQAQQERQQKHNVQLEITDPQRELDFEHCSVCGQPDNCGDCNHYGTPYYEPEWPTEKELFQLHSSVWYDEPNYTGTEEDS